MDTLFTLQLNTTNFVLNAFEVIQTCNYYWDKKKCQLKCSYGSNMLFSKHLLIVNRFFCIECKKRKKSDSDRKIVVDDLWYTRLSKRNDTLEYYLRFNTNAVEYVLKTYVLNIQPMIYVVFRYSRNERGKYTGNSNHCLT